MPAGESKAVAAAIRMLMDDPALRARLGKAGRASILKRFSWRKAAEETVAVYEEILGEQDETSEAAAAGSGGG